MIRLPDLPGVLRSLVPSDCRNACRLDKSRPAVVEIPILCNQVLAEMIRTTRTRVNLFMNRFRKQGVITMMGD